MNNIKLNIAAGYVYGVITFLLWVLVMCSQPGSAAEPGALYISAQDIREDGVDLTEEAEWLHKAGDDTDWAAPEIDETDWRRVPLSLPRGEFPEDWEGNGWFRTTVDVDSTLYGEPMGIGGRIYGAMEVYLNGRKVGSAGRIGTSAESEEDVGYFEPVTFRWDSLATQHLVIRYSNHNYKPGWDKASAAGPLLTLENEISALQAYRELMNEQYTSTYIIMARGGFLLALAALHFLLLWFYPRQKLNGVVGLVLLWLGLFSYAGYILAEDIAPSTFVRYVQVELFFGILFNIFNVYLAYRLIGKQWNVWWAIFTVVNIIYIAAALAEPMLLRFLGGYLILLAIIWAIGLFIYARLRYHKTDLDLILAGYVLMLILVLPRSLLVFFQFDAILWAESQLMIAAGIIVAPLSYTAYFARDFARTHLRLEKKLEENEQLAANNLKKEQENRRLIENRKQELEEQVKQRTSELEQAYNDLEQSHKELKATQKKMIQQEKMASLGELTAGIAHEIKNPLNFITNFSKVSEELIEELHEELQNIELSKNRAESGEEPQQILDHLRKNIKTIDKHGKRADEIIKGMLQHSRGSSGNFQPTDLNALISEYADLAYHGIRAKNQNFTAKVSKNLDEQVGMVSVVPQELSRALLNIMVNGFQASWEARNKNAQLKITTRNTEKEVQISIRDNGPGIPEEIKDKIFQPFFTTKSAGEGTGLGLSMTYDIISAHNGTLKVNSEPDSYTEFIITLPTT